MIWTRIFVSPASVKVLWPIILFFGQWDLVSHTWAVVVVALVVTVATAVILLLAVAVWYFILIFLLLVA
jgi:hypothetical protein